MIYSLCADDLVEASPTSQRSHASSLKIVQAMFQIASALGTTQVSQNVGDSLLLVRAMDKHNAFLIAFRQSDGKLT